MTHSHENDFSGGCSHSRISSNIDVLVNSSNVSRCPGCIIWLCLFYSLALPTS